MRTLCGLVLIVAVGCGGKDGPPPAEPTTPLAPAATTGPAAPTGTPGDQAAAPKKDEAKKDEPKTPPAAWEMDPAKHSVPTSPAIGTLAKTPFTPTEVEFQADTLTFRVPTKEGPTERAVAIKLPAELAKAAASGGKVVVTPTDDAGAKVPVVTVEMAGAKKDELKVFEYPAGYALTLEVGKREKGTLPGKVYLSLPGDEKDFLAGTFAADWIRSPTELPGADDAPFVQGSVAVAGAKEDTEVGVGYVGVPKGADLPVDQLRMAFAGKGRSARSDYAKPRATTYVAADAPDKAGRYEHTRLPAGKYLVFAGVKDGPAAGKWVTVPADGKLTQDFALDPGKAGKLEVKVPAGSTGKVLAVPADDAPVPVEVFGLAASALGLQADVQNGVARFDRVAPGRYEVRLNDLTGAVEVRANETATVELAPPKK